MFFTVTVLVLTFGLGLTAWVLRRFAVSKSVFRGVFVKGLAPGNASLGCRVCAISGPLLLLVAGLVALNDAFFVITAYRTTGTVEATVEVRDSEGQVSYSPKYRYQDGQGREYAAQANLSTRTKDYQTGDLVPVIYSRFGPSQSVINDYVHVWGDASGLALLGSFLMTAGCLRLYWPEIRAHYQKLPPAKDWRQAMTLHLFQMADNFFAMPGTLRFATLFCFMFIFLPTMSDQIPLGLAELASFSGLALLLFYGFTHRSRWTRPTAVATLALLLLAKAYASWSDIAFTAVLLALPVSYLLFNRDVKAYFGDLSADQNHGQNAATTMAC